MDEEKEKPKKFFTPLTIINIVLFLSAIGSSFYFFYIKKDFDFIVEVTCDTSLEQCIQRDCTNPDDCPPNGLSDFKRYTLSAKDFEYCPNEDCTIACESGTIQCEKEECIEDEEYGETCSVFPMEIISEEILDTEEESLNSNE